VAALIERDLRKALASTGIAKPPLYPEGRETATPTAPRMLEACAAVGRQELRRGEQRICFPVELNEPRRTPLDLLEVPVSAFRQPRGRRAAGSGG